MVSQALVRVDASQGQRVTLVRYEVYSYGKHHYSQATSFASFHPVSSLGRESDDEGFGRKMSSHDRSPAET
jgi:hypothetical protein